MKIIEPSFELSTPIWFFDLKRADGIMLLQFVEKMARISHRSEDRQTSDSWERFIQAVVLQHGDWSVTEHASLTATLRVDRGVTHELVRHRLFSFTQESTRFVRYRGELECIVPVGVRNLESPAGFAWRAAMADAENTYHDMLDWGAKPEQARSVLPNGVASTIAMTGNLRNWRHFFLMRTTKETHPDMKRITIPMLQKFKEVVPMLYDDIAPESRQIDNMRLPK